MKRILLIIACIIAVSTSKAQDSVVYKSVLGDSIAEWYELFVSIDGFHGYTTIHTVNSNDTVIISNTPYYVYGCVIPPWDFHYVDLVNYTKYIRESNDRSKLYFRTSQFDNEILIMDLNLTVGDTIDTDSWTWIDSVYSGPIAIVDSVYYKDDKKHIRTNYYIAIENFNGEVYYDTLIFIESIGPSWGIMYVPIVMLESDRYYKTILRCYSRDSIQEYKKAKYDLSPCYTWWISGIDEANNISVTLYPNPAEDKLFITNLTSEEHSIKIISQKGTVVKTITAYGQEVEIDLRELPSGVYNIVIVNSNGSTTKKIIKL